jgi:hypothetical protein
MVIYVEIGEMYVFCKTGSDVMTTKKRDYAKEYKDFHGLPEQIAARSQIAASNLMLKYIKLRLDIMRSTKSGRTALENAFRERGF